MVETSVIEKMVLQTVAYRNDMLKLLALVTMLVDHIGYMYFPNEILLRIIGRLAFPIFAYQIAIGYSRTSNIKKYVLRLSLFALITQIPYCFFSPDIKFNPIHFNVLFTFLAAIGLLCVYDMGIINIKNFIKDKNYIHLLYGIFLLALAIVIIILPEILSFLIKDFYLEYGLLGLALVLLFHVFQEKMHLAVISIILLYLLHGYYRVALWNSAYSSVLFWSNLLNFKYVWNQLDLQNGLSQLQVYYFNALGVFALIPILILESINTSRIRLNKYVGYIFYPAHMMLLVAIALILKAH
ncbi:TraX family protein [Clostridium sp. CF012]|uniref:TraX family protein n=1 Tax=Clostridium sp. CF012 TaxID=2843319 RepID=UPI001C0BCA27|nr:TraX family protein [Clostridium sp. CF012]MBU3142605.1 conjugal transfer protein TraX [Clostridium sp. CF012]